MLRLIGYWEVPAWQLDKQTQCLRAELASPNLSEEAKATLRQILERMGRIGNHIHPRHLIDPSWDPERRRRCIEYLRRGAEWMSFLGYSYCRFQCGIPDREMGASTLTDGVWAWPEGLAHYVERHDIRLPEEFLAHMEQNRFAAPRDLPEELLDPSRCKASTELWVEWCRRAARTA